VGEMRWKIKPHFLRCGLRGYIMIRRCRIRLLYFRARDCAIEFRSFSKNGGFTGTRCGTRSCRIGERSDEERRFKPLHPLVASPVTTKFTAFHVINAPPKRFYFAGGQRQSSLALWNVSLQRSSRIAKEAS